MKLLLALFVFIASAYAQVLTAPIAVPYCTGLLYGAAQQADMADLPTPYNTIIYGKTFSCAIPVQCSLCSVKINFLETRSTNINIGQRVFTVEFPGGVSEKIDLFKLAGSRAPYYRTWTVPVYDGVLRITFSASVLNALFSFMEIKDAIPPQAPPVVPPPPTPAITGVPCTPPVDLGAGPQIYAYLPDGTCLPVRPEPPVGYLGTVLGVFTSDYAGVIKFNSIFSTLRPTPLQ